MNASAASSGCENYNFEYRDVDVFTKYMIDLRIKNGVAVDPQSCHVQSAHVFCDKNGDAYSAYLTQTDVENRKNSYHKLQILVSNEFSKSSYWLFQTYGGIGAASYMYNETEMHLEDAVNEFKKIFQNLTGNSWASRNDFKKIWGKMNMVEIEYTPNVVNDEHVPSQLPESVQRLVKVMIKHRRRDFPKILGQQWPEIQGPELPEIQTRDSRKWPIGILNKKHIEEAFDILGQLINCVTERERDTIEETRVIRLTNKYYSLVPRGLKSDYLRLLDTAEAIQREYEFLDSLPEPLKKIASIDVYYADLSTKLYPMDPEEYFYQILEICAQNTGNIKVLEIFRLDRHGEDQRFSQYKHYGNRKLLWHGSALSNFARIFSEGLIIRGVARHGCLGTGIYFSDMASKSVPYCKALFNQSSQTCFGFLLLCEVALGRMQETHSTVSAGMKLTDGYQSMTGCGRTIPDPRDNIKLEDGVVLALGRGIPSERLTSGFQYNEYIVYEEAQVRMRYLVKFKPL